MVVLVAVIPPVATERSLHRAVGGRAQPADDLAGQMFAGGGLVKRFFVHLEGLAQFAPVAGERKIPAKAETARQLSRVGTRDLLNQRRILLILPALGGAPCGNSQPQILPLDTPRSAATLLRDR
jgi:hypothetical protein